MNPHFVGNEYSTAFREMQEKFLRRLPEMRITIKKKDIQTDVLLDGASGDTELFEKASNINGFQGGRVANNLYISTFRATVFQTAALFLYPNSSVVIRVEKLLFLSL